eukprot:8751109-Karenia_brevis.AAC.1
MSIHDLAHPTLGMEDMKGVLAGTFAAQRTNGDGACAIHSVFGVLDTFGEYFCKQARQLFCDSLVGAYADFESKLASALMRTWEQQFWNDM